MTDSDQLKNEFFKQVLELSTGLEAQIAEIFKQFNLTFSQSLILFQIYDSGQIQSKNLAQYKSSTKGAISQMLDVLESKNLITKTQSKTDKRDWFIGLTPKAQKIMGSINAIQKEKMEFIYDNISMQKLATTIETLKLIKLNLSKKYE